MNVKYGISRCAIVTSAVCATLLFAIACNDDLDFKNVEGKQIAFKITAPNAWHDGMQVKENEPTTHCLSVKELSGDGDTRLYLHTVVADNPAEKTAGVSRGTPIKDLNSFKKKYSRFSISGICYNGEYPSDETQNQLTAKYAHNLYYSTSDGQPCPGVLPLLWPYDSKVRFFAFAPTVEDFNGLNTGGTLTMSGSDHKGSPTLTYTVPADVEKQTDLMTVNTDFSFSTTRAEVDLKFGHALTAVRIECGKDMLAGTISKVTISGIYGSGTQVIGSKTWEPSGATTSYTISKEITLPADEKSGDKIHAGNGTAIAGTDSDNLTFILMPQTLPEKAAITIVFTDKASGTERTVTGSIAGQKWEAGKIITYSISPSSIHIIPSVEFSKNGVTDGDPTGDSISYLGVWYDVKYSPAKVEITQAGVDTKTIAEIPIDKIKFQYKFEEEGKWQNCDKDAGGLLKIAPQPAFEEMNTKNPFSKTVEGSVKNPVSLAVDGETANCYLVDKAGYYSLPLVYGNGNVNEPADHTTSLKYYPDHNDVKMPADGKIPGASDAVLCWQDSPDLIDPDSVRIEGSNLVFHIRKHTLAQGNAVLAVRNASKQIIWSWHIWVTPHKNTFYSKYCTSKPKTGTYTYQLARYNLGWCEPHGHSPSRKFQLKAVIDMSAYGGKSETDVEIGTFMQDEFRGSDAGDNTYYQWGRKDPMLGGIYNNDTPKYTYDKKGNKDKPDEVEFTMENKQIFNQYKKDGYDYSFCKNPGDMIEPGGMASKGVTIGYAIQHPYMFITNSTNNDADKKFNYRNHWHIPYVDNPVAYLNDKTHIMFNAWNSDAASAGYEYDKSGDLKANAAPVKKTVYDPCPPKFQMPPIHALKGIEETKTNESDSGNVWEITTPDGSFTFPVTGVRDYALRSNEWKTVKVSGTTNSEFDYTSFYKISMPAFNMLTYISSATIVPKEDFNAYQVYILVIDRRQTTKIYLTPSSNSYGLTVRPMYYVPESTV